MPSLKSIITKTFLSLLCAHALEVVESHDDMTSFVDHGQYFSKLLPAFAIAYITWTFGEKIHRILDEKFDWLKVSAKRMFFQLASVTSLTVGMFLLIFLEFAFRQRLAIYSWHCAVEILLIIASFTLLINVIMVLKTLYHKLRQTEEVLEKEFPYFTRL